MALLSEEFSSELLFHALELIDISELSSSSDEFERFSGSFSPLGVSSLESQYSTTPVQTNTNAKRRSSKSELERLRSDVQQLEKTLARVKSKSLRSNRVAPAPDGIVSVTTPQMASDGIEFLWMDMAVTQQRRRQQAEATNRLLKRSIAKQLKVAEYLEAMIARRTMVEVSLLPSWSWGLSDTVIADTVYGLLHSGPRGVVRPVPEQLPPSTEPVSRR